MPLKQGRLTFQTVKGSPISAESVSLRYVDSVRLSRLFTYVAFAVLAEVGIIPVSYLKEEAPIKSI
jgi:hypothetical protein